MQADLQSVQQRNPVAPVSLPLTSPSSLPDGDAISLLANVVGSPTYTLGGFSRSSAVKRIWGHPAYAFISAPVSPMDLVAPLQRANRHRIWLAGMGACVAAVIVFTLGAVLAASRINLSAVGALRADSASAWSVARLEHGAVILKTRGAEIHVQVGDRLPNGDLIVSVAPDRNTVLLASGTLLLRTNRTQAPKK